MNHPEPRRQPVPHEDSPVSAALATVSTLPGLQRWWQETLAPAVPHDFAVVGKAPAGRTQIVASDIVMFRGPLRAEQGVLLANCASLLGVWRVMRQAALLDLGPCGCVGQHALPSPDGIRRTFLIHAIATGDNDVVFAILTAEQWTSPERATQVLGQVMPAIARCVARMPEHRVPPTRRQTPSPCAAVRVTPREHEIGRLVREGCTNKEIARQLHLSPNTVRNQIAHLSQKLGARNRAQVALLLTGGREPPAVD